MDRKSRAVRKVLRLRARIAKLGATYMRIEKRLGALDQKQHALMVKRETLSAKSARAKSDLDAAMGALKPGDMKWLEAPESSDV